MPELCVLIRVDLAEIIHTLYPQVLLFVYVYIYVVAALTQYGHHQYNQRMRQLFDTYVDSATIVQHLTLKY